MVTVQSGISHPCGPCCSVARTESSTAVKNADGIEPSSTSCPTVTPAPSGAGSTRRPTLARNGLLAMPISSWSAPIPTSRSTQIGVDSRNVTGTP